MNASYLKEIRDCILKELVSFDIKVVVFGSVARGETSRSSDVDVGLLPRQPMQNSVFARLKEKIENLNVPYKVDLVNLNEVSEKFRKNILKESIVWKD